MNRLPILYRASDVGKPSRWTSWVEEDRHGTVMLCTESGKVDGKLRMSKREISDPGNKGTALAQAIHQAKKKWEDKKMKENYVEHLDAASELEPLPMLANKVEIVGDKIKGVSWPVLVQPKIDGFRCMAKITPGGVELRSRKNKEFVGFKPLKDLIAAIRWPASGFGSGRLVLDGELYIPGKDFNEMSGDIKRGQFHADYDDERLRFIVYDCFDLDDMAPPTLTRLKFLAKHLKKLSGSAETDRLVLLNTDMAINLQEFEATMSRYLVKGYEGIMVRPPLPYTLRKRGKALLKHKNFEDAEFEIIGYKEGEGTDKGTVVWVCTTHDGKRTFSVRPKGTIEHRAQLFADADAYVGRWLTVTYQTLSEENVPRFPVGKAIREAFDSNPNET